MAVKIVAALFETPEGTTRAINDLRSTGIDPSRVSVIARDKERAREVADENGAEVATGAAAGAGFGALLGGAAGWLVGIGALAIPGIGPIVAAGPIAAALGVAGTTAAAGAGVGAITGGLLGALTGWGFSEAEARAYQEGVERGDMLVAVEVPNGDDADRVEDIFKRDGGDRVSTGTVNR